MDQTKTQSSARDNLRKTLPTTLLLLAALAVPALAYVLPGSLWATVDALPAHPLVVHAVVVFAPLSFVLLLVVIARPRLRRHLQWPLIASVVFTSLTSIIAKGSGDSLAAAIGLPEAHARWGNYLVTASLVFLVLTSVWVWASRAGLSRALTRTTAVGAVIAGVAMSGVTYAAGHSGAEASWEGTFEQARVPMATGAERLQPISLEDVSRHASPTDCWSVVEGNVYNLTEFIARHPAGSQAVIEMCGIDATADFMSEHAGPGEPREWLEVFRVGELRG